MEKVKEIIKKHENISIILLILLIITGFCTNIYLTKGDEIWNFQNICKMLNGYKIYTDANVIITPLFHFIGYIFLKIFGQNLLVFRIYNIIIMTLMYFLIYKILRNIFKNKFVAFTSFIAIIIQTVSLCTCGANYNTLAMIFVLLGSYLNLVWIEKNEKHNIIQGIIMFLIFFTKQNIGAFYVVGIIVYNLIKEKNIKNILKQLSTLLILIFITIGVFVYFDIFHDFINCAILGIGEFAKENLGGSIVNIIQTVCFGIFAGGFTIFLIKMKKIEGKAKEKLILLSAIAIPLMLIGFPIYNNYHKILSNIVLFLAIIYILDYVLFSNLSFSDKIKKYLKIFLAIIILFYIVISMLNFYAWIAAIKDNIYFDNNHVFFGGYLKEEQTKEFENITGYIKRSDKNVIVLTDDAALYMIPLKRNNGVMDLPFLGNMGQEGEEKITNKIKETHNTIFLIKKEDDDLFWQESKKVNNYIKENLNYIGNIERYAIYGN